MTRRERNMTIVVTSLAGMLAVYGIAFALFINPSNDLAKRKNALEETLRQNQFKKAQLEANKGIFAKLRDRSFAEDVSAAMVAADARVKELAHAAGLSTAADCAVSSFSSSGSSKKGYDEIACTINSRRKDIPLERLLNFLYLLSQDSRLHSVTNLTISPQPDSKSVGFSLRYATLVLEEKLPVSGVRPRDPATTQPALLADLSDPRRGTYDVIMNRYMFLPYVPQPKPEPVVAAQPPQPQPAQPAQPPPPRQAPVQPVDNLVLTGLPRAGAAQEVHISSPGGRVQKVHKLGDNMGGVGEIVMVDYRSMPMPNEPKKLSAGRVILKIGQSFWAIELGQQVGQRRVLGQDVLPEELKAPPASQPAPPAKEESARADTARTAKETKSN